MHDVGIASNRGANEGTITMNLLEAIRDLPVGDAQCIIQAAAEVHGTIEERLRQGYREIVGDDSRLTA